MLRGTRPTVRGAVLFLVGATITVLASVVGEPDMALFGLFLTLLPVLSLLAVIALRPRLEYAREIQPAQVPVGESAEVTVRLANIRLWAATSLEMHDTAPAQLGGGGRFVVARAFGRWSQGVRYQLTTSQRGRFLVGPLRARAGDPLGLAVASFKVRGDDTLLRVTPKIWALAEVTRGIGLGAANESAPQRTGYAGQDDVLVREHRHGDDIRRVHWRMSAKHGELMVRLEEHPWDPSALVIADTRRTVHSGTGATSSLEWTISAAASLGVRLADDHYRIVMAGGSGTIFEPRQLKGPAQRQAIIDALTDVGTSDEPDLEATFSETELLDATGALVYFGGVLTARDAALLIAAGQRFSKPCALVADPLAWGIDAPEHTDARRLLTNAGWAVEVYAPTDTVPDAWSRTTLRRAAA